MRSLPAGDLRVRARGDGVLSRLEGLGRKSYHRTLAGRVSPQVNQTRGSLAPLPIRAIDVIRKKRNGEELSRAEIEYLVQAYTIGGIPDSQGSPWVMAGVLRGVFG